MLWKIFAAAAVLAGVLAAVIAAQPADFRVERSAVISAPADKVFEQVNDFHNWERWSPWAKLDPAAKTEFEGPESGEGAVFKWSGNNQVGEGSNTITESRPGELVKIRLDFVRPFQGTNTAEFNFREEGGQTFVTWSMYGKNNFMAKAMSLFMDCDKMVGGQFEQGLANLKAVAEKI